MRAIVRIMLLRGRKGTLFKLRGQDVPRSKIDRWMKRQANDPLTKRAFDAEEDAKYCPVDRPEGLEVFSAEESERRDSAGREMAGSSSDEEEMATQAGDPSRPAAANQKETLYVNQYGLTLLSLDVEHVPC